MESQLVILSYFVNSFENPFAFMIIVAGCAFLLAYFNKEQSLAFFLSLGGSFAVANILKHIYKIPRPLDALATLDSYRFPSMHAVLISALATSFWWYMVHRYESRATRAAASVIALFFIFIVCYTRIILGVHKPIDVIAGASIGVGVTLLFHYLLIKKTKQQSTIH